MEKPLTPADRSLSLPERPITGIPMRLADGNDWLLAHMGNAEGGGPLRNQLCDSVFFAGRLPATLLHPLVHHALAINYEISEKETFDLLFSEGYSPFKAVDDQPAPVKAVVGAWLPSEEDCEFEYDDWLRSSLIINGIDPATIPADDVPAVVAHLRGLGKIIEPSIFVGAMREGAKRQDHLDRVRVLRESKGQAS